MVVPVGAPCGPSWLMLANQVSTGHFERVRSSLRPLLMWTSVGVGVPGTAVEGSCSDFLFGSRGAKKAPSSAVAVRGRTFATYWSAGSTIMMAAAVHAAQVEDVRGGIRGVDLLVIRELERSDLGFEHCGNGVDVDA